MTTCSEPKGINSLCAVLTLALVFAMMVAPSSSAQTTRHKLRVLTPPFTANKGELLQELRDRKFDALDTQLNSYQKSFEQNALAEGNVSLAFDAFASTDSGLTPLFDEWVTRNPNSYPAHLARARFLVKQGYQARGEEYADKTSGQQFADMNRLLDKAAKDTVAAIKLNPKSSLAYASLIDAARANSDDATRERVFVEGLKNVPLSLSIRVSEIEALQPRWGGSYAAMNKLAVEAQKYATQNGRLVSLKGFADIDKGSVALENGDTQSALDFYDQALGAGGDFALGYACRGGLYLKLGRYEDALQDLESANRLRPQEAKVMASLAYVYVHFRRPKEALAMIQKYRTFAEPSADLVNLEVWAQNVDAGAVPGARKGD